MHVVCQRKSQTHVNSFLLLASCSWKLDDMLQFHTGVKPVCVYYLPESFQGLSVTGSLRILRNNHKDFTALNSPKSGAG